MMFVKGKDEALLKSIMEVMAESAQETEEQRKKAAQYLEKTTYAGMRLSEAMDWEPEEPAKEPTEAQKKESDRIKATTGKRNKEALEKISAAFAKKKVDETVELTQEEIARLEEIAQGTTPKTAREKDLAAKAEPKDKITHKDVMVARGIAKEEVELEESVKIVDRDSDLDQEHFKLHVNGKPEHFVHHNYENSHAKDSKDEIHYQVKRQLKHLSPADQKKVTNVVHSSYRVKEEVELEEAQYGVNLGSRPVSGQKEYQGKEIKSFHPNKEKEAREFADKHGYVVKKNMLPAGNSITHTWDIHKEEVELEEAVGDNHLHVQQVKHEGQTKYKVHAVGKNFADGIKVGEHLSDTELDDFSEMGGKIKHVKPAAAKPMKEARSLSAILDEARGRPSKKASEDEDEDDEGPDTGPEADQNIMVHLRKSTDTEGNHDVKFSDGSSHKVPAYVAHKVLGAMEKLKPADRAKIQSHIQQSHANLMAVHKMVS